MSSSVFNTALPIYMVTELKMSMASMGMFDGMLEAFSYIVRMMSGGQQHLRAEASVMIHDSWI